MKTKHQTTTLTQRIVSAILGHDNLTPAQREKLAEMDKDYQELLRERDGRKDEHEKSLKQN